MTEDIVGKIRILLEKLCFKQGGSMILHCDCPSTVNGAKNPVYHEQMKQLGVDCHFISEKIERKAV